MTHLQKAPRKPLLNVEQGKVFILHLDNDLHKGVAKNIFVDGMTNEEVANDYFYSKRQVERIRISLLKTVLKSLIEKQIPKKVELLYMDNDDYIFQNYPCPCCGEMLGLKVNKRYVKFCPNCGQALDWSENE